MAILRTIDVTVTGMDAVSASTSFAGYSGEHLATRLEVTVPAEWDGYGAYVTWKAADGWLGESAEYVIADPDSVSFVYDIPRQAMKAGALSVCITARRSTGDDTQIAHTASVSLSVARGNDFDGEYDSTYNSAIKSLSDRISAIESVESGGVPDGGVYGDTLVKQSGVDGDAAWTNVEYIANQNSGGGTFAFWSGTEAEYNDLPFTQANGVYYLRDIGVLRLEGWAFEHR